MRLFIWIERIIHRAVFATVHRRHRAWRERVYSSWVSKADQQVGHAWEVLGDGSKKPRMSCGFSRFTGTMLFSWEHEPSKNSSYLYRLGSKDYSDGYSIYNVDYNRQMGDLYYPKGAIAVAAVGLILNPEGTQEDFENLLARYQEYVEL